MDLGVLMWETTDDYAYAQEQMRKWKERKKVPLLLPIEPTKEEKIELAKRREPVECECYRCGGKLLRRKVQPNASCRRDENRKCHMSAHPSKPGKPRIVSSEQRKAWYEAHAAKVASIPVKCVLCGTERFRRRQDAGRQVRCKASEDHECFKRYSIMKMRESRERRNHGMDNK